jgi:hypothetical protein
MSPSFTQTIMSKKRTALSIIFSLALLILVTAYFLSTRGAKPFTEPLGELISCTSNDQCRDVECSDVDRWYCEREAFSACIEGTCRCLATCL